MPEGLQISLVDLTSTATLSQGISTWWPSAANAAGSRRAAGEQVVQGYSWLVELLPHLGHQDLYSQFDFSQGWMEGNNALQGYCVVSAFIDPSNPLTRMTDRRFEGLGVTHFVGVSGVETGRNDVAAAWPRTDPRAGVFGYDAIARLDEIADGTSNTFAVASVGRLAGPWMIGGGATIRGAREPYFGSLSGFLSEGAAAAGAKVLLADGSARFVASEIDPAVFRALCTIHGGEQVDLQSVGQSLRENP